MRKLLKAIIGTTMIMMLFTLPVLSATTQVQIKTDGKETVATLVVKIGLVKVTRFADGKNEKAYKQMHLYEGDKIETGELARAALLLHDGSMIKLNENSTMQLEISVKKSKKNRIKLLFGHLWAKVKKQESNLEIETPSAVAAIKGTMLEILVKQIITELIVWDGSVGLRNPQGNVLVGVGQRSSAKKGKAPSKPTKVDLEKLDNWFDSVVNIPRTKTLKTTIRDKDGKEQKLNIKYDKK
ncbi:FecR family protein [bacterium]|nr:FecR family protein [bacterium]